MSHEARNDADLPLIPDVPPAPPEIAVPDHLWAKAQKYIDAEISIPEHLREKAEKYFDAELALNTRLAYQSDLRTFALWCGREGRASVPASAGTVIGYLTSLAESHPWSTISRHLSSIGWAHIRRKHESPRKDPAVQVFLKGLRKTLLVAAGESRKKKPLLREDIEHTVAALSGDDLITVRDRAIVLLGFACAFRRSELSALNVEDLEFSEKGILVKLRKSKSNQEGRDEPVGVPADAVQTVSTVKDWLVKSGLSSGPLFRSFTVKRTVNREGRHGGRLLPRDVGRVVLRALVRAGLMEKPRRKRGEPRRWSRFGAHSLRSGFITQARLKGRTLDEIMTQSRHKDEKTARGYIQHVDVFVANPARGVAL